ncbi:MAG: hypothetical protein E7Z75_04325 [Methanobrevibacter olleyae]|uniref:Adhesin-like protein n=1 Tax=Methanobrevibacter olleyae TaxID=294671 RepID=A0A8T3VQV6_METOL|nr:hypothetical protein [Methanobrevibacter olleyae]
MSSVSADDIDDIDSFSLADVTGFSFSNLSVNENAVEDNNVLCSDSSSSKYFSVEGLESNDNSLNESNYESNSMNLNDSNINVNSRVLAESNNSNDIIIDSVYYVDSDNFTSYFVDGVLKEEFEGSILVFNGEFVDKGVIDINSPNVIVVGSNSLLNNTVFCLQSSNIMLSGLNFVLDKEFSSNDYAGILVLGDNCTVFNCTMDYSVPYATTGFCVYAEGSVDDKIVNFTLANNTFNFIGNNLGGGWDYGIFIDYVDNAIIHGNDIICSLPLRSVDWSFDIFGGVSMDSVGAFVAQGSNYLTLSNNNISSYVTGGGTSYPTLDTVILYGCNNAILEYNDIYCEDFDSKEGKDNYLQGIDIYFANDVTILNNRIDIRTTGGRAGMGTAYPIQVNGPSYNVKIAFNNLSTMNFGPNIGIYSQNYYGSTKIDIISNFINVTGLASTHYWALVAGIEVQDSEDLIWNNTIIVTNIGNYSANDNIYGISYSQNTQGNHTYNIQYNNVTTNGRYAVSLSGTNSLVVDSIVANNVLNTNVSSGNRAVRIGQGNNNTIRNNTDGKFVNTLNDDDLPDWLKNHKIIVPHIVLPKYYHEASNGSGLTDNVGNGTLPWNINGSSGGTNNGQGNNRNNEVSGNGSNPNSDNVIGSNRDAAPGIGGISSPSLSAAIDGDSGSSAADPDTYEIDEKENLVNKSINSLSLACIFIIVLLLLLLGYKHQKDNEEE